MQVNIPKSNSDKFYRYKRIVLPVHHVQKNGGITRINVKDLQTLCKQIGRDSSDIIKLFKRKLNTNVRVQQHVDITGVFSWGAIDDLIEEYIEKNVLCVECGNPETVVRNDVISCKACGFTNG